MRGLGVLCQYLNKSHSEIGVAPCFYGFNANMDRDLYVQYQYTYIIIHIIYTGCILPEFFYFEFVNVQAC